MSLLSLYDDFFESALKLQGNVIFGRVLLWCIRRMRVGEALVEVGDGVGETYNAFFFFLISGLTSILIPETNRLARTPLV